MNPCEIERKIPKYEKMKNHILSMIESGELKSGDKLPTEEELAARFAFSLTTTKKALTDLAGEGVIIRIKKKGTFVSGNPLPEPSISTTPRTVSFILPLSEQTDDTLMQHVRGAQGYFAQQGYSMLIEATNCQMELEDQFIDQAIDNQLSGLIIFPVSPEEIDSILRRIGMSDRKVSVNFTTGDRVKILTGPFSGIEGSIDAMNDDTQTATVLCILFGRETPTEIAYNDLEKVEL